MKKFLAIIFTLLLVASCEAAIPDNDIIILYTNDVHCAVDENIGYAGVEYYKHEMQKITPYVSLVDAGDWARGGIIGVVSSGKYLVDIMNKLEYDIAVPGNHEFDYGIKQFNTFNSELNCGFIACNFRQLRNNELVLHPYKILNYGDVKIAFVGICTPETMTKSTPSFFLDASGVYVYDFDGGDKGSKLYASVQKAVDDARKEGADYVIAVGHLGEYENNTEYWSAPAIVANTRGIDALIDGHSHEVTPELKIKNLDGMDVIITQAGTQINYVGKITISKESKISSVLLSGKDIKEKDEEVTKFISDIQKNYEGSLKEKLSHTDFDLLAKDDNEEWLVRNSETNLSNLVADALLNAAKTTETGRADIAFSNGGGIRTNIKAGDITLKNVINALPFNNYACIVEVTGRTILDELEIGARLAPHNSGGFLQPSGLTYTIDTNIPTPVILDERNNPIRIDGKRRVSNVLVNGKPIVPNKKYTVISLDYVVLERGDGHMFRGAKILEPSFELAYEVLRDYLRQFKTLPEKYKAPQGRIKIK